MQTFGGATLGLNKSPVWSMIGSPSFLRGLGFGLNLSSIRFTFEGEILDTQARLENLKFFAGLHPALFSLTEHAELATTHTAIDEDWPNTVQWLLALWFCIQERLGAPVIEKGRILHVSKGKAMCVVPASASSASTMQSILIVTVRMLGLPPDAFVANSLEYDTLKRLLASLEAKLKTSSNVPKFLAAARLKELPMLELPGGLWQFGVGRRARWLDSSYTDVTPLLAHKLSKRKDYAATMLRDAGIPVPAHSLVRGGDHAVQVADKFGYPVVVKPADKDGGLGVFAELSSPEDVLQAYAKAAKLSSNVLVERHVRGCDYRVVVFQGQVTFALQRLPAGVIGDGQRNVGELLLERNSLAIKEIPPRPIIVLDQEALRLLDRQGLSPVSVPFSGQQVRLRSAANYAIGGSIVVVTDEIHPDNARLAIRAAEALRLDLAGVDLIMPDITRSWHESGAAICEVNGQPQLGRNSSAHLYGDILNALVPGNGRIPTVVVLGGADAVQAVMEKVSQAFAAHRLVVGLAGPDGVRVGDELISSEQHSKAQSMRVVALDRRVDAIVVGYCDASLLYEGLPFARFDWLMLVNVSVLKSALGMPIHQTVDQLLGLLVPACDGEIFCDTQSAASLRRNPDGYFISPLPSAQILVEKIKKIILQHDC